jgi:hypothetical protein
MESPPVETKSLPPAGLLSPVRFSRRPFSVSLILVGLLTLCVLSALTPRYETNDDAGMSAIVSGRVYVDRPDEHLLFSNVLVGLGLKSLYEMAPSVPWYGGLLFVVGCLSLGAICYVCLQHDLSEWRLGLTGILLWVAGVPVLTQLQFTRIAFVAGLAGLLLLVAAVREAKAARQKWLAIPFLLAAGLIRYDALRLVCVVLVPVILWMLWRARRENSPRIAILILAACVALAVRADHYNKSYYAGDPAWRDYYPFNAERIEFIDYGHVEYNPQTAGVFAGAGWLPVDLGMLRNWAFLDRQRFNTESLRTIVDALPSSQWQAPRPWLELLARFAKDGELWGLLACGLACLAILSTDKSARFVPLACYAVTALTCALLYRQLHLPPRVYCPAVSACAVAAIVFANGPRSFGKRRPWVESRFGRSCALAAVAAVILWRAWAMWRSNADFLSYHKEAVEMVKELAPQANQLYVVWAGDFPLEYVTLPLDDSGLPQHFKVLDLNWTLGFAQRRRTEFHITDWMSILRRGDGTFLVCQPSQTELLAAYVRAHHGLELKFRPTFAHHALYDSAIYQVAIAGPAPRSP